MDEKSQAYDFFLAHAGPDANVAERLYELLRNRSRVFLDSRSLRLGDDWDTELSKAQRNSKITVVIISERVNKSYYQREEIAAAIALARDDDRLHRVVPLYLPEVAESSASVPYGLRLKHSIRLTQDEDLRVAAEQLLSLLASVGIEGAPGVNTTLGPSYKPPSLWKVVALSGAVLFGIALVIWSLWGVKQEPPLIVVDQIDNRSLNDDAKYVGDKIQRNLSELLTNAGHRVAAPPFSVLSESSTSSVLKRFRTSLTVSGDEIAIHAALVSGDGSLLASTELNGPLTDVKKMYKVLPEAILFGLDVDERSLIPKKTVKRSTTSVEAFANYLFARRNLSAGDTGAAQAALESAIHLDKNFALAYWSLGQLLLEQGDPSMGQKYIELAGSLDPDHSKISMASFSRQSNPVPALMAAIRGAKDSARELGPGFRLLRARSEEYGIEIRTWEVDPAHFDIRVIEQTDPHGSSVGELLHEANAILAINGGCFDIDHDKRLRPAGILVVDGVIRNASANKQSGALVRDAAGIRILWAKTLGQLEKYDFVIQTGPVLVEGPGQIGIRGNDYDRLNRAAVCSKDGIIIFVLLHSTHGDGLSLYEFAELLAGRELDGGLGCTLALNLDGGPSTQAAMAFGNVNDGVDGLWKIENAIVVRRR